MSVERYGIVEDACSVEIGISQKSLPRESGVAQLELLDEEGAKEREARCRVCLEANGQRTKAYEAGGND